MTKTALKALLGGGGLLATWLAVTPNHGVPHSTPAAVQQTAPSKQPSADDLRAQADRLRARTDVVTLRESTRNPFRFNGAKTAASRVAPAPSPVVAEPVVQAVEVPPPLTLNGVTGKQTPEGVRRTAVISGNGQMYFVGEGDSLAGRYTVVKIDPEAVVLRDASGAEVRLGLP
jgi:type II secretory pathway component PulC